MSALAIISCKKDDAGVDSGQAVTISSPAVAGSGFSWSTASRLGVFSDNATKNVPFQASAVDASGKASFEGQLAESSPGALYAYYPYNPAVGRNPHYVHFNLEQNQSLATNAANNTFMVATPLTGGAGEGAQLTFNPVSATIELSITVPASLGEPRLIQSVTIASEQQPFYIQTIADITENKLTWAARGPISARPTLTLTTGASSATAAGGTFTGKLFVLPDDYATAPMTLTVATDEGNYDHEFTLGAVLGRGESHTLSYTLDPLELYDPTLPKITAAAQASPNPVSTPIKVGISEIIAAGQTPATITFTPAAPAEPVLYTITSADRAAGYATVSFGQGNKFLQPETFYSIEVHDASSTLLAAANATTLAALVDPDMQLVEPGTDIGALMASTTRKTKVFLKPGNYTNTSVEAVITTDLILMADSPLNTIVTSSKNLAPKGTIATLSFSGFTWKVTAGHFLRPQVTTANGSFLFTDLNINNVVFDFSEASSGSGIIFFPRARAADNGTDTSRRGKVTNYTINNCVYIGKGASALDDMFYCVLHTGGTDFWVQLENLTIKNSTFSNTYTGLIVLPQPSAAPSQLENNGDKQPTITLENNTFYKMACAMSGSSALIQSGASETLHLKPTLRIKNNVLTFGGSSCLFINFTTAAQTLNAANYANNWGLTSQSWLVRLDGSSNVAWSGQTNTAATLFEDPMDNPLAAGASFKVTATGATLVGDPRWY